MNKSELAGAEQVRNWVVARRRPEDFRRHQTTVDLPS
jgi:hypothetical protein